MGEIYIVHPKIGVRVVLLRKILDVYFISHLSHDGVNFIDHFKVINKIYFIHEMYIVHLKIGI